MVCLVSNRCVIVPNAAFCADYGRPFETGVADGFPDHVAVLLLHETVFEGGFPSLWRSSP